MNDPKIVDGGEIPFDDSASPLADTLTEELQDTHQTHQTVNLSYEDRMYGILADRISIFFEKVYEDISSTTGCLKPVDSKLLAGLNLVLATSLSIKYRNIHKCQIQLEHIDSNLIRNSLEAEYGPEIAQAGFYKDLGLDESIIHDLTALTNYFPEYKTLLNLNGKFVPIYSDPYFPLLLFNKRSRPFYVGALEEKVMPLSTMETSNKFNKALDLRDILNHAKTTGRIAETKELLDYYNSKI